MSAPVSTFQILLESVAGGPLPDWDAVQETIALRAVEPGAAVFHQDVDHPFVYVVRDGLVKLGWTDADGRETIQSFADEGRFFGSLSALQPGGLTTFTVVALEPSTVERLDFRLLWGLAQRHLAWSQTLLTLLMNYAARRESRARVRGTLSAEDRWLAFRAEAPELAMRVPEHDLARHLALTPRGLSRVVSRVRRREGDGA